MCAHLRVHACTAAAAVRAPHFAFLPACLPHIFLNSALILHSRGVHSQNRFARILSEASPRIYLGLLDESKPRGALGEKTRKKITFFSFYYVLFCWVKVLENCLCTFLTCFGFAFLFLSFSSPRFFFFFFLVGGVKAMVLEGLFIHALVCKHTGSLLYHIWQSMDPFYVYFIAYLVYDSRHKLHLVFPSSL